MLVTSYPDAVACRGAVLPFLLEREAENNLMISIILRLAGGSASWGDEPPRLLAVLEAKRPVAVAVQTPPHNMILTRMNESACAALAEALRATGTVLPGVTAPDDTAVTFAACWAGDRAVQDKGLGCFQLDRVIMPAGVPGAPTVAGEEHESLLMRWVAGFNDDTHAYTHSNLGEIVRGWIAQRAVQLWLAPEPVSMASAGAPTPNGIRVSGVYTPPEHRGCGYASANVAALSRRMLESGRRFCYLFTDLANPTANDIYQRIGYRKVCDFQMIRFPG